MVAFIMAQQPPDLSSVCEIFIDESSQTKHRHLVIGCVTIRADQGARLEAALAAARLPELPQGEIGWTKVSRSKLDAYKRFVDVFFDNPDGLAPLEMHALAVDTHRLNDRAFNEGSREIGFNKEIYQICQKCARLYRDTLFHVYPDHRETKTPTNELRLILNRGLRAKGDERDWPFRRVHFRDSSKVQTLQLVDLLIGAIAYRLNGHHLKPDASPAKTELSRYILERAGVADVTRGTAVSGKFTVWHRRLQ